MNVNDLKFIEEIISRADRELIVPTPFSTEEKLLAAEHILISFRETKSRIPEIRQSIFDDTIKLSKYSNCLEFSEAMGVLGEDIKSINSFDDDDIYLIDMFKKSKENLMKSFTEMEKLGERQSQLLEEYKSTKGIKSNSNIALELEKTTNELLKRHKEYHVARIIAFYYQEAWDKKNFPMTMDY